MSVGAVRRAAARLALLWCLVALLGVPFALRSGWRPVAVAVEVGVAACGLVAVRAFGRRSGVGWAALMLVTSHVTTVLVGIGAADALRPEAAHQIISWINSGVGSALALAYGARWGVAAFVLNLTAGFVGESVAGGDLSGGIDSVIGPFTYVLGGVGVRWAARRGEAATERALQATEAAESALQVAERRWDAARAAQRELHDTVLATLTILAHRGSGVPREVLLRACARDAERLRQGAAPTTGPAEAAAPPGPGGVRTADRTPSGMVDLADVVEVVDEARATGFDVRVHVADDGHGPTAATLTAAVGDALRHALRECLENARRHSGVRAADVTVVVDDGRASVIVLDEGRGFDPAAVPPDRLGLRDSVSGRLADVGGSVTVWSGPGLGTSVLLAAPVADGPARDDPSTLVGAS